MDASPVYPNNRPQHRGIVWRDLIRRTLGATVTDRMNLAAAGCAFYATLALFPAITMLISIYGLVLDPRTAEAQLAQFSGLLPPQAYELIADRVHHLVAQPPMMLNIGLAVSFVLAFWSSSVGSRSILSAVNVAFEVTEDRSFLRVQALGFAMTLAGVVCAVLAISLLVLAPALIDAMGLRNHIGGLLHVTGMATLVGLFFLGTCVLYRFGPSRRPPRGAWIRTGAGLATVVWVVASELLSVYASRMSSFGATYGPLGAVVAIMLWFYVSAYAVLLGAELNARLEEATRGP